MRARASIVADASSGTTRLVELRSEAPLVVRSTADAVYLVGGAGGPLGGDELDISVCVRDGASLTVRSAAATMAQPGRDGGRSLLRAQLAVGADASLTYRPEPLISVRGSDHETQTTVELGEGARLELHEELVLGRHEEAGGRVRTRLVVRRVGRTVLVHELDLGGDAPGWSSGVVLGGARVMCSTVVVGPDAPDAARVHVDRGAGTAVAWMPVSSGLAVRQAIGPTLTAARGAAEAC